MRTQVLPGAPKPTAPQRRWPPSAAVLLLGLTAAVFWWPCLGGGRVPVAAVYQQQMPPFGAPQTPPPRAWDALLWDSVAQFYPWRLLLQRGLRSGELPLWNPYQYCGYPFVGNGQSALFYPPNWLLLVVDVKYFLGLSLALHWLLAGALTFFLARRLNLSPAAAVLAGLVFQASGFMITWAELPTVINSMAWLPGAWLGGELLFRGHRRRGLPLLAGCLGLSLLAGHLQFAAYVWLATALYALARVGYRWVTRRSAPVALLAAGAALGLLLGLPQVLPSLELGANSPRGEQRVSAEGWEFQRQRALQPVELATFVIPEALGDPVTGQYQGLSYTEHCGYAGILALVLALLGVALRRDRWAALLGVGALAALSVAMAGPPAKLLYFGVPPLGVAGGFARILGVYTLCLALLAGRGLQALLDRAGATGPSRSPLLPRALAGAALLLVAVELFPWGWRFLPLAPAEQVYPETALTRKLQELSASAPGLRTLVMTPRANWTMDRLPMALLPPNADTVYGWYSPQGYDSLSLASYRAYAQDSEKADVSPAANGNMMLLNSTARPSLSNLAPELASTDDVRWLVSLTPVKELGWRLREQVEGAYIYDQDYSSPALAQTLNTVSPGDSDRFSLIQYPGWRAYADNVPVSLRPLYGPLACVRDYPGQPKWFAFYPETVVVGLFLGLLSLALLAGSASFTRRPRAGEDHA
ncbi:MAG TPA: hypothetical protein VGM19_05735 [Armatimonadota bacterium]|jgi:hypothetical protein